MKTSKGSTPKGVATKRTSRKPTGGSAQIAAILGRPQKSRLAKPQVPERWRWHYGVLSRLQERLVGSHEALNHSASQRNEVPESDPGDRAADDFDHHLALAHLTVERDALTQVTAAIERILGGTYGQCAETGKPIPAARLKAIPWTRYSREAEERLEAMDAMTRARLNPPPLVTAPDRGTPRRKQAK